VVNGVKTMTHNDRDEQQRWSNYRSANKRFPSVRTAEITELVRQANIRPGETVLEVGTGSGIATYPLARAVGNTGKILTFDTTKDNLIDVVLRNTEALTIIPVPQSTEYNFPVPTNSVDAVANIAALHHYDDRSKGTGYSGRQKALTEFYRMLKPGGRLIIADVAKGTPAHNYFDACDNPIHCAPRGHPHDFLSESEAQMLCKKAGFKKASYSIKPTPWRFTDETQAKEFLHTLHNSQCIPEESLELAKKHLPYKQVDQGVEMGWSLFYLEAHK